MRLTREEIGTLLAHAVEAAQHDGTLPIFTIPDVPIERPQHPEHGDYASTLALKLARAARMRPTDIARVLVDHLPPSELIDRVDIAGPGFINFTLSDAWVARQVNAILAAGEDYGRVDLGQGKKVQVEFVSANPTGPLHAGSGRGAALGDTLAGILAKAGYHVEREYYVNDAGTRMLAFYASAFARYAQRFGVAAEVPEDGYHGAYMIDLGRELAEEHGRRFLDVPREQAVAELGLLALDKMVARARADMDTMGVTFDRWFHEQTLFDSSAVAGTLDLLRRRGHIAEHEGAIWFATTALGEDKDSVLVRGNGIPTYFASDIAYHHDKFLVRGFDWVIDIWGADHQGHVPRMKAAMEALGLAPDQLTVLIHQMITLRRGEEVIRMSKRTGDIVTLREVLEEVGRDACRFFFLARSADSQMDFDLELAKQQSADNPVYYVQYAHARIASILRVAAEAGFGEGGEVGLLGHPAEMALVRQMLSLPELVADAAQRLEPHHLPHYAQDLARMFHLFYQQCRVVDVENPELSLARLRLARAARIVLANTLGLIGVSAPEQM